MTGSRLFFKDGEAHRKSNTSLHETRILQLRTAEDHHLRLRHTLQLEFLADAVETYRHHSAHGCTKTSTDGWII
jgi:hypothetical protein